MAQAMAMRFPKELEKHWFRDLDKGFLVIWLLSFVILNTTAFFLSQRELRVMTQEELQAYTEVVHRVKVDTTPVVKQEEATTGSGEAIEEEEEEAVVEEEKPKTEMSAQAKQEVRDAKKEARRQKQAARKAQIASKIKVLAAPTARGGRSRRGRSGGGRRERAAALGLSGGGLGAAGGMKGSIGIVSDAGTASAVQKLRGGGAIGDEDIDLSGLDIGEALGALSSDEMGLMLNEAPVELNKKAITAKGKAAKSAQRSQKAISEVVMQNKNQVQYCYWRLKRRDSSLKGKVQVRFTIEASGEVSRVKFRSKWSGNNPLGGEAETCIENVIKSWRFPPIAESEGKVTAGATYIFE